MPHVQKVDSSQVKKKKSANIARHINRQNENKN